MAFRNPPLLSRGFSLFGGGGGSNKADVGLKSEVVPSLKLQADKNVYRPGEYVSVTVEVVVPSLDSKGKSSESCSFLIEKLGFEIKGIEKLDTQWFATQKPLRGSKQRRGEHVFMESSIPTAITNQIVPSGSTKTYTVRALLPGVIPPSYKGAAIRYLYYFRSALFGRWLMLDNGHSHNESSTDIGQLDARIPLQIWVTQEASGVHTEESQSDGIVPPMTIQLDLYWKELDADSDWARANDAFDGVEEGYESSRDEISSVSSYNPMKDNFHKTFGSSLSLESSVARSSSNNLAYLDSQRLSSSSQTALPLLSESEVIDNSNADSQLSQMSSDMLSPSQQQQEMPSVSVDDDAEASPTQGEAAPVASEGFVRGRSYNIRFDDQVLLRFSPKNSDSTYYFSDTIGGALTFFHEKGSRRCLEVSITLETSETISRRFVHPSRRNSPTITKVQSDHYEVVSDLLQTSFLFSIPMDGPMSFSTPHVSVQWVLRFEFFITPKNLDWTRCEHPLLIEGRDKSEWVLPIVVHAPPPRAPIPTNRNEKTVSLESTWAHA